MHPSIAHEDRELPIELSDLRATLNRASAPSPPNPSHTNESSTDKSFVSLLGHAPSWRPAPLAQPHISWTGSLQRYRLIKDLRAGSLCAVGESEGVFGHVKDALGHAGIGSSGLGDTTQQG
jgi:hypothetical protein